MARRSLLLFVVLIPMAIACTTGTPTPVLPTQPPAETPSPSVTAIASPALTPILPSPTTPAPQPTATPLPQGALVKGTGPEVFLIDMGVRRLIATPDVFFALGYKEIAIITVPQAVLDAYPEASPIHSTVLQGSTDDVYVVENGVRRHIPDVAAFDALGYQPTDISRVSDTLLRSFPAGEPVTAPPRVITARARSGVNVRSGPSTDYPVITTLRQGDMVEVVARTPLGGWLEVKLPGYSETAWVFAALFDLSGSLDVLPVADLSKLAPAPVLPPPATPTILAYPPPRPTSMCPWLPVRAFGKVWSEQVPARELAGCPVRETDERMSFEAQRFEHGVMLWTDARYWEDRSVVWVLFSDDSTYARIPDTWMPGFEEPTPLSPPDGLHEPRGRLGKAWREGAGVRARLGWAVEPPVSGSGAWQLFNHGLMFRIPYQTAPTRDWWIYVLSHSRNAWAAFADTWEG